MINIDTEHFTNVQKKWKKLWISLSITYALYLFLDVVPIIEIFMGLALVVSLILNLVFIIRVIVESFSRKSLPSRNNLLLTLLFFFLIPATYLFNNGYFWGKKIMQATFIDDRSSLSINLFERGKYIVESDWLFGVEKFSGNYQVQGDTLVLSNANRFNLSDKLFKIGDRIYFSGTDGRYDTSFYFFQIDK